MLRNFLVLALAFVVLLLAAVFAALNPGTVSVDLAFTEVESQKSLAFTIAFGVGCIVGALFLSVALIRMAGERRRLRKSLKLAESEVQNLRKIPLEDAN